jgi:hypothetical protein
MKNHDIPSVIPTAHTRNSSESDVINEVAKKVNNDYFYEVRNDYIFIVFSEAETLESCKREAVATRNLALQHNCRKILADNRTKPSFIGTFDEYELAKFYQNLELHRHLTGVAMVVQSGMLHRFNFYEVAVRNRWLNLRIFSNLEEAECWIKEIV